MDAWVRGAMDCIHARPPKAAWVHGACSSNSTANGTANAWGMHGLHPYPMPPKTAGVQGLHPCTPRTTHIWGPGLSCTGMMPTLMPCRSHVQVTSPLATPLQVRNSAVCAPAFISSSLRAGPRNPGQPNTDFYLLVTAQASASCTAPSSSGGASSSSSSSSSAAAPQSAGALAWAMACDYSLLPGSLGRPILGVVNLCPGAIAAALLAVQAAAASGGGGVSGGIVDVLVHELMHALGLSAAMYSSYLDPSEGEDLAELEAYEAGALTQQGGTSYLSTPTVASKAQQMLNCSAVRLGQGGEGGELGVWGGMGLWQARRFCLTPFPCLA